MWYVITVSILSGICSGSIVIIGRGLVKWIFQLSSVQVQNQTGRIIHIRDANRVLIYPLYEYL